MSLPDPRTTPWVPRTTSSTPTARIPNPLFYSLYVPRGTGRVDARPGRGEPPDGVAPTLVSLQTLSVCPPTERVTLRWTCRLHDTPTQSDQGMNSGGHEDLPPCNPARAFSERCRAAARDPCPLSSDTPALVLDDDRGGFLATARRAPAYLGHRTYETPHAPPRSSATPYAPRSLTNVFGVEGRKCWLSEMGETPFSERLQARARATHPRGVYILLSHHGETLQNVIFCSWSS